MLTPQFKLKYHNSRDAQTNAMPSRRRWPQWFPRIVRNAKAKMIERGANPRLQEYKKRIRCLDDRNHANGIYSASTASPHAPIGLALGMGLEECPSNSTPALR